MDSNQTRLQLLLGRDDWARCTTLDDGTILPPTQPAKFGAIFAWNPRPLGADPGTRASMCFEVPPVIAFQASPSAGRRRPTDSETSTGSRISETEILVRSSGTYSNDHFWSSSDEVHSHLARPADLSMSRRPRPASAGFSGLTVTEEQYLVVGTISLPDC